ncbi:MAG: hypothetical protein HYX32_02570 [Actinobacteria bacterium]|nr:hypothetical protein [Actinomycetota bacterium]
MGFRFPAVGAVLMVLLLASCASGKASRPPVVAATTPGGADQGANPPTTYKATPECNAVRAFVLAGYYATQAPPEKVNDFVATAQRGADEAKVKVPALTPDIDTTMTLLTKSLAGQVTDADKATNDQVAGNINRWVQTNCG